MGDRRTAEIISGEDKIYFYTHWSGHRMEAIASVALRFAEERRHDKPYALRAVIDQLIKYTDSRDQLTNSGIMFGADLEDEYALNGVGPSLIIDLNNWVVLNTSDRDIDRNARR